MQRLKYGKLPFSPDARDFKYAKYRGTAPLPQPPDPDNFGHDTAVPAWGMLGNDAVGDCAIAGPMHMIELWTAANGRPVLFTTQDALDGYSAVAGYDPRQADDSGNNATDTGCVLRDVLKYWKNTGFTDSSGRVHQIGAFLQVDAADLKNLVEGLYIFGASLSGLQVPDTMQDQFSARQTFTVVPGARIDGGHCMPLAGKKNGLFRGLTWNDVLPATVEAVQTYYDEHWIILTQDQVNGLGVTPEGFNMDQLRADLSAL